MVGGRCLSIGIFSGSTNDLLTKGYITERLVLGFITPTWDARPRELWRRRGTTPPPSRSTPSLAWIRRTATLGHHLLPPPRLHKTVRTKRHPTRTADSPGSIPWRWPWNVVLVSWRKRRGRRPACGVHIQMSSSSLIPLDFGPTFSLYFEFSLRSHIQQYRFVCSVRSDWLKLPSTIHRQRWYTDKANRLPLILDLSAAASKSIQKHNRKRTSDAAVLRCWQNCPPLIGGNAIMNLGLHVLMVDSISYYIIMWLIDHHNIILFNCYRI
jgi:hypothetical protein